MFGFLNGLVYILMPWNSPGYQWKKPSHVISLTNLPGVVFDFGDVREGIAVSLTVQAPVYSKSFLLP